MDDRQAVADKMMAALKRFGINSKEELFEAMKQGKGDLDIGMFVNPIPGITNEKTNRSHRIGDGDGASGACE